MQKNMLGVIKSWCNDTVCPAECVVMGDKTAGVRKCNSYLTNGQTINQQKNDIWQHNISHHVMNRHTYKCLQKVTFCFRT